MALPSSSRREEGSPAMVENLEAFKKNWSIFTENSLSQLADWSNAMRKYFHEKVFPSSDVDLFLYSLTVEEAERKIITIYEVVRDSVPWDVTCVRTKQSPFIHNIRTVASRLFYASTAPLLRFSRVSMSTRRAAPMMAIFVHLARTAPADVFVEIYERSVGRVQGLARLLAIEKLATPEARALYQYRRSLLRGRPWIGNDVVNLHIPYGPGWDARRIERLIYKTDYSANSPYNPKNKNRRLHRHSAFFGTAEESIEDRCESETAYVQAAAKFFGAISKNDVLAVKQTIEDGEDLTNRRDHVGRTPLHVAILSNSVEVGCVLVDVGARMTARLVGGRTCLHLEAQMGQVALVEKMLERSAYNKEKADEEKRKMEEAATPQGTDGVRMSSEDDWSSDESDDDKPHRKPLAYTKKDELEKDPDSLEDNEAEPDILDISIHDWDFGLTALGYGTISGSVRVVDALLAAGADPCFAAHTKNVNPLHSLTLTTYAQDAERGAKIAERLVAAQAISSTADDKLFTIFHRIVLNSPAWYGSGLVFPIVSTIATGNYATLFVLLAHGAILVYFPEDVSRAEEKQTGYIYRAADYRACIYFPMETALCQRDEVISLLAALGANVDVPTKLSTYTQHTSLLQWTSKAVSLSGSKTTPKPVQAPDNLPYSLVGDDWSQYHAYLATIIPHCESEEIVSTSSWDTVCPKKEDYTAATQDYFAFAESVLRAHGATLPEGAPTSEQAATTRVGIQRLIPSQASRYTRHTKYSTTPVPVHLKVFYDELYEACWKGDNASVQELCLPKQVSDEKEPIQIVVQTTAALEDPSDTSTLWTPFVVALHRRHWDTARLVLAIAEAQYQPPDTEMDGTNGGILRDDSDSDEEREYDSDEDDYSDYSEEKPINFTDIAARSSPVRTDVPPTKLLRLQTRFLRPGLKADSGNPLQKAIIEDFIVHTLNLYEFAGAAIWPDSRTYDFAVALDRPNILDELIRRSGIGIPIPSNAAKASGVDSKKAPEERVYLRLKVGGKRHTDIIAPLSWRRQPLMLAIKRKNAAIAQVILEFGIDPSVLLLRDADGSTPLHVAVQNADTVLAETPLDIANLKGLSRVTGPMPSVPGVRELPTSTEHYLYALDKSPPFIVEKQKIEIPKLRATLDMLLAEGTKLMTELLAFANRMEGRLSIETARKNAAEPEK
ncbi:hypothetical protein EDB87DRAFT_1686152 [Lactarius vividus]|nr:hypothetical protein EDB87DRAFT_1686152 [Lactarius vividus]